MGHPSILRPPAVRLTAARAPERKLDLGQGFKHDGLRIQSGEDGLTCNRTTGQNIRHVRTVEAATIPLFKNCESVQREVQTRQSDVICSECGAGFRRLELSSQPGEKAEYRCPVRDCSLEVFDGGNRLPIGSQSNLAREPYATKAASVCNLFVDWRRLRT